MKNRVLRALLLLVTVCVGGAAAYTLWGIEKQITAERAAEQQLRDRSHALLTNVADLRASQQAYVAQGQGQDFWIARVSSLLPVIDQQLSELGAVSTSDAAHTALGLASAAVENVHKLDARALEYLQSGQDLMASDLIFSDGLEATTTAAAQIDLALGREIQARELGLGAARRRQMWVLGGASGIALLVVLLLLPTGRQQPSSGSAELRITPGPDAPETSGETAPRPQLGSAALPDLAAAAQLCTDFGRVLETRDLTTLLGRAAQLLDASGIVVWMGDTSGGDLRPAIAHGYSDQVLARMGTIPRDATNAAAAAYRTAELRIVSGGSGANGGVVAPLITPDGCVGVLATELRGGGETRAALRALVAIFAAQLATLVSTPPASSSDAAQAQG